MTLSRAEIQGGGEEIREALVELSAAQADPWEATATFDKLARQQADMRRWHDAAAKDVNPLIKNEG